jgi:hypothetical protein
LRLLSRNTLGSATKWHVLLDKLYRCDWRCAYTGELLVLGVNLSFDHIKPVARFSELKYEPTNLEPVSLAVNMAKRDMSKEEFIEMCNKVSMNANRREADSYG